MKEYRAPKFEEVKYDVNDCLDISKESQDIGDLFPALPQNPSNPS